MPATGSSLFDLTGRHVVVTGARRGIGLAIAVALAEAGADVTAVSARLEPAGSEVQRRVERAGRRYAGHDIPKEEATRAHGQWKRRDPDTIHPQRLAGPS